jgi:hypothetical protein
MSFDLEITIGGLCLLVPEKDATGSPKSLHVLMPETPTSGTHEHRACLLYLKRYHDPAAGAVDREMIDLAGKELDLATVTSDTPLDLSLSREVFDFSKAPTKRSVDSALVNWSGFPTGLRSRARLNMGAEVRHRILPGGIWMLENAPFQMATAIVWRLRNVPGDRLALSVAPQPLVAIDEGFGPTIRLFLLHVVPKEVPGTIPATLPGPTVIPKPPFEADHFHHYYPLLNPTRPAPNPWFVGLPGTVDLHANDGSDQPAFQMSSSNFGSELTCMVATGPLG